MTLSLDNIYMLHDEGMISDKFLQEYEDIEKRVHEGSIEEIAERKKEEAIER